MDWVELAKIIIPQALVFLFGEAKIMLAEIRERRHDQGETPMRSTLGQGMSETTLEELAQLQPQIFDEEIKKDIEHYCEIIVIHNKHRRRAERIITDLGGPAFVLPPQIAQLELAEKEIIKYTRKLKNVLETVYGRPIHIDGLG